MRQIYIYICRTGTFYEYYFLVTNIMLRPLKSCSSEHQCVFEKEVILLVLWRTFSHISYDVQQWTWVTVRLSSLHARLSWRGQFTGVALLRPPVSPITALLYRLRHPHSNCSAYLIRSIVSFFSCRNFWRQCFIYLDFIPTKLHRRT